MLRSKYISYLEEIKQICKRNNLNVEFKKDIENLQNEIKDFKIRIPLVGGFNAGKSSLINSFLGESILPENITPETAIASEIKYGPNMIIVHKNNGETEKYGLEFIKSINTKEVKYLEILYNNERLKSLGKDVIIVDMPGFDSNLEEHNKAINQYLDNGVAFIIVIDCEDGCIKSNIVTFLYELYSYNLSFGVIVNKCDKKTEEEVNNVCQYIKSTVEPINSNTIVESLSAFEEDASEKLMNIIKSFDIQQIIKNYFEQSILSICERVLFSLNVLLKNSNLDTEDINKKINNIEKNIIEIDENLRKEEIKIDKKISKQVKQHILNDINLYLINSSGELARAAMDGESSFKMKLNELLRPALTNSTSNNLEPIFNELINKISINIESMDDIEKEVQDKIEKGYAAISNFEEGLKLLEKNKEFMKKFEKYYKVATSGLAIVTSVVAPWIELIIVFLPDILKLVSKITGNTQYDRVKEKLEMEMIPNITRQIEPEIEKSLIELKEKFISELKMDVQSHKEDLKNSLNKLIEMKNKKQEDFEQILEVIKQDINILQSIKEEIVEG